VNWPTGVGAKGNEGVAAQLTQLDGGLGYAEVAFVKGALQAAALQNGSGDIVKPTNATESEALAAIDLGPALIGGDPNPAKGYPIVTFTWILAYKSGNGEKAESLKKAFTTMLSEPNQALAPELGYVTMPPSVVEKSRAAVALIGR
jgi:phosphate transport system substrate-binding protein